MTPTSLFEGILDRWYALGDRLRGPEPEPFADPPKGWRRLASRPVATAVGSVGLLGAAAAVVFLSIVFQSDAAPARTASAVDVTPAMLAASQPPLIIPTAYADMSPAQAELWNARMLVDTAPNPAAAPFRMLPSATSARPGAQTALLRGAGGAPLDHAAAIPVRVSATGVVENLTALGPDLDYSRALDCLTAAIHYEAATEGPDGMRAVAQVVLNRVRHPAFPHTVCGVVFQGAELPTGCQFTFTCDGSLAREPLPVAWLRARQIATEALAGAVYAPVGEATHYHTRWVVPFWASNLSKIGDVGAHIFYKWKGGWGTPAAFNAPYLGSEMDVVTVHGVGKAPFRDESLMKAILATPMNVGVVQPVAEVAAAQRQPEAVPEAAAPAHADVAAVLATAQPPKPIEAAIVPEPAAAPRPTSAFNRAPPRPSRLPVPGGRW